jgi:hypothetical protein
LSLVDIFEFVIGRGVEDGVDLGDKSYDLFNSVFVVNGVELRDNTGIFNVGFGGCKFNDFKQGGAFKVIEVCDKTLHKGFV